MSEANREAIEDERLSYIIGARLPELPYVVAQWRRTHPDGAAGRRDKVAYYQYRTDPARRTLRGIDEQVAKAEKAVVGKTAVKRNGSCSSPAATRA